MLSVRSESRGFALIVVLLLLAALYAGATGIFVAARAELWAASNLAEAERAFHAADGGLVAWLADPIQPATKDYPIGGVVVRVEVLRLLEVDSITSLYRIVARAARLVPGGPSIAVVDRTVTMLGLRAGAGRVEPAAGTWRERFWR